MDRQYLMQWTNLIANDESRLELKYLQAEDIKELDKPKSRELETSKA